MSRHPDPDCCICPRLCNFRKQVHTKYPQYHCRPVHGFGDPDAGLLVVGLAPGLHGANRTGRPFTGDSAGKLLYRTLFDHGLSSGPESSNINDGLRLFNCRITNAVKCLPPGNNPTMAEVTACNTFLYNELEMLKPGSVIIALGKIAHDAVLLARGLVRARYRFAHGNCHHICENLVMHDSYHCSRYNTQTGRLTAGMFESVVSDALDDLQD